MPDVKDLQDIKDKLSTHEEIARRAYELYLTSGEDGHDIEHWLVAEEQLRQAHAKLREPIPPKNKRAVTA